MAKFFLKNPGFELGDRDWIKPTGWTIVKDTPSARSGDWLAKKAADAGVDIELPNATNFAVRPGNKITASAWFNTAALTAGDGRISLRWLDFASVSVGTQSGGNLIAFGNPYTQSIITDAVAPDRAKFVSIEPENNAAVVGGIMLCDDVSTSGDIIETIPTTAKIQSHTLLLARTIGAFDPLIGDTKYSDFNAGMSDKWAGVFTFIPLHPSDDLGELLSFLERLGQIDRFFAFDPDRLVPKNGIVNGMTVDGPITNGTNKIPVKAGPVSSIALVAGDYMEVKDQYFQLQRDLEIGPEGTGEAIVAPAVRSTFADGEDVITNNPKMVARITSEVPRRSDHDKWTQLSVSWEEV